MTENPMNAVYGEIMKLTVRAILGKPGCPVKTTTEPRAKPNTWEGYLDGAILLFPNFQMWGAWYEYNKQVFRHEFPNGWCVSTIFVGMTGRRFWTSVMDAGGDMVTEFDWDDPVEARVKHEEYAELVRIGWGEHLREDDPDRPTELVK